MDRDAIRTIIFETSGVPFLYKLPFELLEKIRQYSADSLLWRYTLACQLANYVSTTLPKPLLTVPLRDLLFWERGGRLERISEPRPPLKFLRLTIDSVGISKVERLPSRPKYVAEHARRSAFIVQDELSVSDVVAQVQVWVPLASV